MTFAVSVNSLVHFIFTKFKMSVFVVNTFATLLNHATKFTEVRESVSRIRDSNRRREKRPEAEIREFHKIREIWQPSGVLYTAIQ